jgi:Xaa-Pro aminopeptidase
MHEQHIAHFDDAQRRCIALLSRLKGRLAPGLSERAIARMADELREPFGFSSWFYPPEVQIGASTTRAGVWRPPSTQVRLHPGDLVMIALGPSDGRACGDVCATFHFGEGEPSVVEQARACTRAVCGYASGLKCVGELFIYARTWALNHQLELANPRSIGHAVLPPFGRLARGYPRSAHMATWLRRHQIHFLNPRRLGGVWGIGPQLVGGDRGARFRELVLVTPEGRRLLGRDSFEQLGCFEA